jgi:DNA-binding protein YbaB
MFSVLFLVFVTSVAAFSGVQTQARLATRSASALHLFGNPDDKPMAAAGGGKKDGGMFGGMGNLMDSMKKAQEIAKQAEVVNKELQKTVVTGNDASGDVTSTYNGLGVPISIKINDALAAKDADTISAACTVALISGHTKAQEQMMSRMQAMYKDAGLPTPPTK